MTNTSNSLKWSQRSLVLITIIASIEKLATDHWRSSPLCAITMDDSWRHSPPSQVYKYIQLIISITTLASKERKEQYTKLIRVFAWKHKLILMPSTVKKMIQSLPREHVSFLSQAQKNLTTMKLFTDLAGPQEQKLIGKMLSQAHQQLKIHRWTISNKNENIMKSSKTLNEEIDLIRLDIEYH